MLKEKLIGYHIILASGSPRRQEYFKELGIDFEIRLKEIDEVFPDTLHAEEITDYLSELKAKAFEGELAENDILITSDTIVWHEGKALNKPGSYQEAFNMISSMAGKTHEVITSVCFKTVHKTDIIHEKTRVTFLPLSEEAIEYYIKTYHPYDKAGSYGIQEWIGLVGISGIEGSYANVVGLPVHRVYEYLSTFV